MFASLWKQHANSMHDSHFPFLLKQNHASLCLNFIYLHANILYVYVCVFIYYVYITVILL